MPNRIQLKRTKGWRMPPNTKKVDRSTPWGNPFNWSAKPLHFSDVQAKSFAVVDYSLWLKDNPENRYPKRRAWILDHIHELKNKNLACWCKPNESCHADVLLRLANPKEVK